MARKPRPFERQSPVTPFLPERFCQNASGPVGCARDTVRVMIYLRQVATIMAKDLRAELRTKEAINGSLSFALVVLLLFSFAFVRSGESTHEIAGGLLWIVFAFAGALLLNRSFTCELVNNC